MQEYLTADYWRQRLASAEEYREEAAEKLQWDKMVDYWDTGARNVSLSMESDFQDPSTYTRTAFCNWIFAFCQTFLPAVYWKHPRIIVRPRAPLYLTNCKFADPIINVSMELARFRLHTKKVLNDALAYGHGWLKLGWFTRFGEVPSGMGTPGKGLSTLSQETYLTSDAPYAYRVRPDRILLDPSAGTLEEMRWIAQEQYWSLEDVENDPYLKNKKEIAPFIMKGNQERPSPLIKGGDDFAHKEGQWVKAWEIWDREHGGVYVLCHGSSELNRVVQPWPWKGLDGFPFKRLAFTESLNTVYPVSVVLPWLPLVEELAFLRTMRIVHIKKMLKKCLLLKGALDEKSQKDLRDPSIDFVEINSNPREACYDFDGLKPDPNLYASEERVKQDIREISGFSEILSGSVPFSRIAAATSAIMERNASIRFDNYSEILADFICDCAKDLFKIVRDYQPYPQTVQVAGEPDPQFIKIERKELDGDYYYSLDLEELSVSSKQQRIKEKFDMLAALSGFPEVKRDSLVRDFLLANGITDITDYLLPPAGPPLDPMYENSMMMQGYPVQPNPGEDFQLHLRIHAMFTQSPDYGRAVTMRPQLAALFSEHIQLTTRMADAAGQMMPGASRGAQSGQAPRGGGGPSPTSSQQQGQAMASSQPPGGPTNGGGGGGIGAMRQALGAAGGGFGGG